MTNVHESHEDPFSSMDVIACPHCGTEAIMEVVFATGEENIQCHNCGYSRRLSMVEGSLKLEEYRGYGAYKVQMAGMDRWECGSFTHAGAAKEFETLMKTISANVAFAGYSQYINGEIKETVVINNTNINE